MTDFGMGEPNQLDGNGTPKTSFVSTREGETVDMHSLIDTEDQGAPTKEELLEALEYIRQKKAGDKRAQNEEEAETSDKDSEDPLSNIKERFRRVSTVPYWDSLADTPKSKLEPGPSNTGAGAVVNNIKPPELRSLDPKAVIDFLDRREDYEQRITALSESSGVPIHMSSWKLSI